MRRISRRNFLATSTVAHGTLPLIRVNELRSLTGFGGGLPTKRALPELERGQRTLL